MGKDVTSSSTNRVSRLSILDPSTPTASGPPRPKRNKASQACAKCRAIQKRCENGMSPGEADKQNSVPSSCDRCIKTGSICIWDDSDFRNSFNSRDALTMEAQIERLRNENAILRRRLEEHGLSPDVAVEADPLDSSDEEHHHEDSAGRKGKQVGKNWYGGPSPFKDQEDADAEATWSPGPRSPSLDDSGAPEVPSYHLCRTLHEVQSLDPRTAHEWLRYLPGDSASFLSRLEHDRALQNFFTFFSDWQLRVISHLFLRDFALATGHAHNRRVPIPRSQTRHYSPLIHNAILSVALAYSDNEHLRSREVREKFAKHAKLFLEAECRSATLSTVQGLAMLSSFHSGLAEQSLGFMYFGMSVRMAQTLGLHVSVGAQDPTSDDSFERSYVFWSLLAQDKCWSLYVGRDQGIRLPHYDIVDPPVIGSMDNIAWTWVYDNERAPYQQPSYLSQSFVQQVLLMKIAGSIIDVVYSMQSYARRGGLHIGKVIDLHLQLRSWEAKLPRTLHIADTSVKTSRAPPHIMMVNLAYHWLSILLLRPLFKPAHAASTPPASTSSGAYANGPTGNSADADSQSRAKVLQTLREVAASQCPASANQIVRLFKRYDALYGLRFIAITGPQIAYTAGQVHLGMHFAATTPSAREKSHNMVLDCIDILEKMGESWVAGRVTASILKRLLATGGHRSAQVAPRTWHPPPPKQAPSTNEEVVAAPRIDTAEPPEWSNKGPDHSTSPMAPTNVPPNSMLYAGGHADVMDYAIYSEYAHSGQLWPWISPPNNDQAASNYVSGSPGNIAHEADSLQLLAQSVPSTQSFPSSTFDTSIPAWPIPFPDVAGPSEHAWTWDGFPSNYPEQQHLEQFLRGATADPQLISVDQPSISEPIPSSLGDSNVGPIAMLHTGHGSYPVHHSL